MEGILLTMYDAAGEPLQAGRGRGPRALPDEVFETVIPRNVRISEAPSFGQPVILYDVRSKGAESYFAVCRGDHRP